jgi:hypothetical protein
MLALLLTLCLLVSCATIPEPVTAPAPPKATAPSARLTVEDIEALQTCLWLIGYEQVMVSGVYSTPTAIAWTHYLQAAWGQQWFNVPKDMIQERLLADCQEARLRRQQQEDALPLHRE